MCTLLLMDARKCSNIIFPQVKQALKSRRTRCDWQHGMLPFLTTCCEIILKAPIYEMGPIVLPGQSPFRRPINPEGNSSSFPAPSSKFPFLLYFPTCRGPHEGQPLTQKRKAAFTPKERRTVAYVPRSGFTDKLCIL